MASSSNSKSFLDTRYTENLSSASNLISRKRQWRLFRVSLVILDTLMLSLSFWIAYTIRFSLSISIFQLDANPSIDFYNSLSISLILVWLTLYFSFGLYNRRNLLGGTIEYARIFNATSTGMIIVIFVSFLFPDFILARGWLLSSWIFSFFFTTLGRFSFRRVIYRLRQRGYFLSSAVILGANNEGLSLAEQLIQWKTSGLQVVGFVDEKLALDTPVYPKMRILGNVDQLEEIIKRYDVEELILASSSITGRDRLMDVFYRFGNSKNVNLRMSSGLYEVITTGLSVKEFAYVPLVGINKVRMTGFDRILKLLLDYSVSIPFLILGSPLFVFLMLAIKLDSTGPVIYRRRVMGMHGRQFDALKFRTMYTNGDEILDAHPELKSELAKNHKLKDDPRVTRLGNILRKFSLDELPQIINVLKRDMSIVGPRMISPEELGEYQKWYMNLLTVRPGITGYWQVSGRSDISYEERVSLDMYYIRNWTIWFDLQLIIQTIPAVLRRRGAY